MPRNNPYFTSPGDWTAASFGAPTQRDYMATMDMGPSLNQNAYNGPTMPTPVGGTAPTMAGAPGVANSLNAQQIQGARDWLNQQFGTVAPSGGWQFNGDFSVNAPGMAGNEAAILGAAQGMGYDNSQLAQILGSYTPDDIGQFATDKYGDGGQVNAASVQFAQDQGWTDPMAYQQFMHSNNDGYREALATGWQGGANGGFSLDQDYATQWQRPEQQGNGGGWGGWGGQRGGGQGGGNPHLQGVFDNISQQWTNTLNNQWLPQVRSNSIAAGGLGGARQTIGEDNAIAQAGQGLAGALAGAGMGAWENQQGRDLQRYGIDTNASLTNQGQWMGYQNAQDSLNLQGIGLGAQLTGMGNTMPWYGYGQMGGLLNGAAGNNNSTNNNSNQGGGWGGALGGALAGWGMYNQFNNPRG